MCMMELGQLERHHEDFAQRHCRVVVVSLEGLDDAKKTQDKYPDLLVLADKKRGLANAAGWIHPNAAPDGDANAPTKILVDRTGIVRWLYREPNEVARMSPDDVLHAIDTNLGR
jgi:alkyl hydroperoxide reductase subunit AhpC